MTLIMLIGLNGKRMKMTNKDIHPKVGEFIVLIAEVISVKFNKDDIIIRYREHSTKARFNITYKQQELDLGVDRFFNVRP